MSERHRRLGQNRGSTDETIVDLMLVDQLAQAMQLRGLPPDPERDEAIEHLHRLRNLFAHRPAGQLTLSDLEQYRREAGPVLTAVIDHLTRIQNSSLGTSRARAFRRQTAPEDLSEILDRAADRDRLSEERVDDLSERLEVDTRLAALRKGPTSPVSGGSQVTSSPAPRHLVEPSASLDASTRFSLRIHPAYRQLRVTLMLALDLIRVRRQAHTHVFDHPEALAHARAVDQARAREFEVRLKHARDLAVVLCHELDLEHGPDHDVIHALIRARDLQPTSLESLLAELRGHLVDIGYDFVGADLRAAMQVRSNAELNGIEWSETTWWPPAWREQIQARSTEIKPGVFRITSWGGTPLVVGEPCDDLLPGTPSTSPSSPDTDTAADPHLVHVTGLISLAPDHSRGGARVATAPCSDPPRAEGPARPRALRWCGDSPASKHARTARRRRSDTSPSYRH